MESDIALCAEDVAVHYGGVEALHPISLSIERGGLLLVLGPNGAGKTSSVAGARRGGPAALRPGHSLRA